LVQYLGGILQLTVAAAIVFQQDKGKSSSFGVLKTINTKGFKSLQPVDLGRGREV
jgi:hypothetical protein